MSGTPGPPIGDAQTRTNDRWIAALIAVVLIAAIVTAVVVRSGGSKGVPNDRHGPGSPSASAVGTLSLKLLRTVPFAVTGSDGELAAKAAAKAIRGQLNAFYQQALANEGSWPSGPPVSVWNAFDPLVRQQAQQDAAAFTLGTAGPSVQSLSFSTATVTIKVLLDDQSKVLGAVADVTITGTAAMRGNGTVPVAAHAEFLLSPVDGVWLITGYPMADVTVGSASANASPSGGAGGATP